MADQIIQEELQRLATEEQSQHASVAPQQQPKPQPQPPNQQQQHQFSVPGPSQSQSKTVYGKELRCMMYGFGDDKNPYTESVEVLEELVFKYIKETTRKAMNIKGTGKITVEDIMYLIRKDKRKCDRVKELLLMNEELKRSRKAFDLESLTTHKNL